MFSSLWVTLLAGMRFDFILIGAPPTISLRLLLCLWTWRIFVFGCGRPGFDPWVGKIPWRGEGYPLQYSGLENSRDCIVHGVAKGQTRLSDFHCFFFWWFQHPPVDGCSTASSNFDAPAGGDEHMSFYSAILNRKSSSVLTLPTWRSSQNPQVKGSVPQDRRYFRQPPRLSLYFWPVSHTSESSITPAPLPHLLKFNYFARAAHRTQKNILLTRLAICVGRVQPSGRGTQDRFIGGAAKLPTPPKCHVFPNPEALQTPHFAGPRSDR